MDPFFSGKQLWAAIRNPGSQGVLVMYFGYKPGCPEHVQSVAGSAVLLLLAYLYVPVFGLIG